MNTQEINLVLDPSFIGEIINNFSKNIAPIWIRDSRDNDAIINRLRKEGRDITTFLRFANETRRECVSRVLSDIDDHYGEFSISEEYGAILLYGVTFEEIDLDLLKDLHLGRIEKTPSGYKLYKNTS